jgi:hypothetical protein
MDNQKAIEKIKKLFALSKSDEPHEAALALKKAQELMNEYNISMNDIEYSIKECSAKKGKGKDVPKHKTVLANMIKNLFSCDLFWRFSSQIDEIKYRIIDFYCPVFVGNDINAEIAQYTYDVLLMAISKAKRTYKSKKRLPKTIKLDKDSYVLGWVNGVRENTYHLVPFEKEAEVLAIAKYLSSSKFTTLSVKEINNVSEKGFANGFADGLKININKPISTKNQLHLN